MTDHRLVVIGHGMVAARLLDELHRRGADGVAVTVLAEEAYEPYNRLLLSDVLAGRTELSSITLPAAADSVATHRGCAARRIDRERQVVVDELGREHGYDTVVLATGARAVIPPLPGLDVDGGSPGVRALRSVDDCRDLLATASRVDHMTVLGGGLLGIEVACGLRRRGVAVSIVHLAPRLMERQLDEPSARVLQATLSDLGIEVTVGTSAERVLRQHETLVGVRLGTGEEIATDQLVVTVGVRARDELAADAGIPCDAGVLVGYDLRSQVDARVAAIGDCARTPEGCHGLLAPGLRQAERLAADLAGSHGGQSRDHGVDTASASASRSTGGGTEPSTVRLKAAAVDAVILGEGIPDDEYAPDAPRITSLLDPQGRRAIRVATRGEEITGAVCLGAPTVAASLTQAYQRPGELPLDPARLLVTAPAGAAAPADSPTTLPDGATVCRCNGVTKRDIVAAYSAGDRGVDEVSARTRCGTGCGGCRSAVEGILEWMAKADPDGATEKPRPRATPRADHATSGDSRA